jgi:hypothetical protein
MEFTRNYSRIEMATSETFWRCSVRRAVNVIWENAFNGCLLVIFHSVSRYFDLPNSCEINQEQSMKILLIYEYKFIHNFEPVDQKHRFV